MNQQVDTGCGDATSAEVDGDVSVGAGGAFGAGGDVTVDNSDNSLHDVDNTSTDDSINDSFQDSSDNSLNTDNSVTDSGNMSVDA